MLLLRSVCLLLGVNNLLDDAGKNKNVTNGPALYARKVEEEDEVFTLPKVDLSFRLRLQKARRKCRIGVIAETKRKSICDSGI